jgi:hypothetical protein
MTDNFLSPRLCGKRFDDHAIPLEFLQDLAVLEEMIVEVAKWKFLEEHSERKRSPRRFTEGIELKLVGINEGSVMPVIALVVTSNVLFHENTEYFEKARDSIIDAIAAVEKHEPATDFLPEKALSYFDRFGRNLRDEEAIEFTSSKHTQPARLTKDTRRKLLLSSTKVKELTEETLVRGAIHEADQQKMTFQIQRIDGKKLRGPIPMQHFDTILEAFQGYKDGVKVLLHAIGKFDRSSNLQSLESIEHISILDPIDVSARLEELRLLKDGWLDGKGIAPDNSGLDWLSNIFEEKYPDHLPLPLIFPTAEGCVLVEWSINDNEISIEIDLSNHTGNWHSLNLTSDKEVSAELGLDTNDAWEFIITEISNLIEGKS